MCFVCAYKFIQNRKLTILKSENVKTDLFFTKSKIKIHERHRGKKKTLHSTHIERNVFFTLAILYGDGGERRL